MHRGTPGLCFTVLLRSIVLPRIAGTRLAGQSPHAQLLSEKNDRTPDITQADDDAGMFFMAMPDFIIYFDQCLI